MTSKTLVLSLALACTSLYASAEVETYKIDPTHSSVKFSIRHFVAKTTGSFGQFAGTITVDRDDLSNSAVEATIQVPSVDTDNAKRDAHLQADDFFDAAQYPAITFKSTQWEKTDNKDHFKVTGNLTMLQTTQAVVLDVHLLGFGPGMKGAELSGWEATTQLDRTAWGINGGKPAVGSDVDITINIEAVKQ
jgi:polyisoprenoid-binding protein YceI